MRSPIGLNIILDRDIMSTNIVSKFEVDKSNCSTRNPDTKILVFCKYLRAIIHKCLRGIGWKSNLTEKIWPNIVSKFKDSWTKTILIGVQRLQERYPLAKADHILRPFF